MQRLIWILALVVLALGIGWLRSSSDPADSPAASETAAADVGGEIPPPGPAPRKATPGAEAPGDLRAGAFSDGSPRVLSGPDAGETGPRASGGAASAPGRAAGPVDRETDTDTERTRDRFGPGGGGASSAASASTSTAPAVGEDAPPADSVAATQEPERESASRSPRRGLPEGVSDYLADRSLPENASETERNERKGMAEMLGPNESPEVQEKLEREARAAGY